jgi:hypothetical protein
MLPPCNERVPLVLSFHADGAQGPGAVLEPSVEHHQLRWGDGPDRRVCLAEAL